MAIYQEGEKFDIKLDVSEEFPRNISVYYVYTNGKKYYDDPNDILYGTITGPDSAVARLESNLINELESNE